MRRRIVFSIDEMFAEPTTPETARIVCSKGMEAAASFAVRFQVLALVPWAEIFTSGTPEENGFLYSDSPVRREILKAVNSATIVSVRLRCDEAKFYDGEDKHSIVCEIKFRKSGELFKTMSFFFRIKDGWILQYSSKIHNNVEKIYFSPDNLENALADLER